MGWFTRNYQGQTFFCGEHAGAHFQAILDHYQNPELNQRYSPRYGVIKIKTPSSPVYDGFPISAGTSMTAIFKWLQKMGAATFEPLENDVLLPAETYCNPSAVTPAEDADAANHKIISYGFDALTFPALQQAIYQNKAVILLIHCDSGFWGTSTPTFNTTPYTHFIVAYGYDAENIYIVDSADPNSAFAFKAIHKQYVTPQFFLESGTALDMPVAQLQQIVQSAAATVQAVSQSSEPVAQKETLLDEVEQAIEAVEEIL